tara:strand:- start:370 stop:474 length:105 start_codon:yes stop_codon:yes gene_type:complete
MRKIQDFIEYWKFSDEDRGDDYWDCINRLQDYDN